MVEKINGLNPLSQTFSTNGMKLSQLKESNELLFKFFKSNGYKEDQIIYSTDIDKVIEQYDTNNDDKLSQKELKKMFRVSTQLFHL